ncbi:hypothetical protein PybrP1_000168 [[Pythium] brassicae (nom. inval.)]|nr:hypothetical protein PybrP1_000168 [[Pythium] brassicae (nom. inval.)]
MAPPPASPAPVDSEQELLLQAPLPHERVVYWGSGSPQAWRVLIALEEKRVPYRGVCVSFASGVLKSPFFRALNPRMRVPVLVEPVESAVSDASASPAAAASASSGGAAAAAAEVAAIAQGISHLLALAQERVVVTESAAILEFLERKFPHAPSLPAALPLFALAQSRMHEANELLSVVGDLVVYLRRFPRDARNAGVVASKWAAVDAELGFWERQLAGKRFLVAADAPFLCDFILFTNVAYAVRCGLRLDGLYPRLAVFYARLCARASVDATWPPHWRTSPGSRVLTKCGDCQDKAQCECVSEQELPPAAPRCGGLADE